MNFKDRNTFFGEANFWADTLKEKIPMSSKIAVVSLAFDHLEIPFELVIGNLEKELIDQVLELQTELPRKIDELRRLNRNWKPGLDDDSHFISLLSY